MTEPIAVPDSCWRCINTGMVLPVSRPITNRQAIERAIAVVYRVQHDTGITPAPYEHLQSAIGALREAARSPLDEQELDADGWAPRRHANRRPRNSGGLRNQRKSGR